MFNSVIFVRELCAKKNIPVSLLEKECGFSNGYLNPKKLSKIPADRALRIAEYLEISVTEILPELKAEKTPTVSGEHDILDEVDVAFYGDYKELSEDDKETLRAMARVMRERRARKEQK